MPSPTRRACLTVIQSEWIIPVEGAEGMAFLPESIPDGQSVTLDGSIKARILPNPDNNMPKIGQKFSAQAVIKMRAVMPWLDFELPKFDLEQKINLEYPCELRDFQSLATAAVASTTRLQWKVCTLYLILIELNWTKLYQVYNKSNRPLGLNEPKRQVEVDITVPPQSGSLWAPTGEWDENVTQHPVLIPKKTGIPIFQALHINPDAEVYRNVIVRVDLYISDPQEVEDQTTMVLIQQHEIRLQVTDNYNWNENSSFLLVTNANTNKRRTEAIHCFISEDLKMEADTWNIGLYAGMTRPMRADESIPRCVIPDYGGKSLLFLGNNFDFHKAGSRTAADLCDPSILADFVSDDSAVLFTDTTSLQSFDTLAKSVLCCPSDTIEKILENVPPSGRIENAAQLVRTMQQDRRHGSIDQTTYSIPISKRRAKLEREARQVASDIQKQLPQERCLVSWVERTTSNGMETSTDQKVGDIVIYVGIRHQGLFNMIEPSRRVRTEEYQSGSAKAERLDNFERYMIISSLPITKRVDILWTSSTTDSESACSPFAIRQTILSIISEIQREMNTFTAESAGYDTLVPESSSTSQADRINFFKIHLPTLAQLLQHPNAVVETPLLPPPILEILQWAVAGSRPQNKGDAVKAVLLPFSHRRGRLSKLLSVTIGEFLSNSARLEVRQFMQSVSEIHSVRDSKRRNSGRVLLQQISDATSHAEDSIVRGKRTGSDVVPRTEWCTPQQWNAKVESIKKTREKIRMETEAARKETVVMTDTGNEQALIVQR